MNQNPYQPPLSPQESERPEDVPGKLCFREFRVGSFTLAFSTRKMMRRLRDQAAAFVNSQVGVHNVVSIAEHSGFEHSITVWYRTSD